MQGSNLTQVIPPLDKMKRLITSHSIDNVFDYCARKFEFLTLYDRRPKRESGFAADVGTSLHDGAQAWLIARAEGMSEEIATNRAFIAMAKSYPWDMEQDQRTRLRDFENTALMLYTIIRSPEWDDWELLYVQDKGWAVEVPFLILHTSLGPIWVKNQQEYYILCSQGKIDMIMRNRRTGKIRSVDIKTTAKPQHLIRSNYTFSGQQTGYSHVVHKMAGIEAHSFEVVYLVCRFDSQEIPQIEWITIEKSEEEVDDYWLTKLDRIHRIKNYAEQGWFPRTNGECNAWNAECSMFDICHTRDPALVKRWFEFDIESEEIKGYDYWVEMEL